MRIRWVLAVIVVAVLAAGSIALAARGGDDDNDKPAAEDISAIKCPLEPVDPSAPEPEYRPAKDAFDTKVLLDKPLADARSIAAQHGCEIVVSVKDGGGVPVPLDFDPARIFVYTEKDIVTQIEGVGGGL